MTDSLTDTSLLDKMSDVFADGIEYGMDAIFGDSRSPNDYPGGKIAQDTIGWRPKKAAAEANKNDPNNAESLASPLIVKHGSHEWPLGLGVKGSENNGPFIEFRAFEYKKDVPSSAYRRSGNTVGEFSTVYSNPITTLKDGKSPTDYATHLFTVRLPFRGNVRKNAHAETVGVDNVANQALAASQFLRNQSPEELAKTAAVGLGAGILGALASKLPGGSGGGGTAVSTIKDQISLTTAIAVHPAVETLYKNPTMNDHTFEFTLVPRNSDESVAIRRILDLFQGHALPAEIPYTAGLLFNFPALFEIFFCDNEGNRINGIRPIPDCMIQNIDVIYDPTGTGRLMADNTPIAYRLNLNFIEQKIMTRNDFDALKYGHYLAGDGNREDPNETLSTRHKIMGDYQ